MCINVKEIQHTTIELFFKKITAEISHYNKIQNDFGLE